MSLTPGTRLGQYEILGAIGAEGAGACGPRAGADLVLEFKTLDDAAVNAAEGRRLGSEDTAPLATFNASVVTATATLIVGASRKPMEATGSTATEAMERLARDVEAFARANAAKLRPPERD